MKNKHLFTLASILAITLSLTSCVKTYNINDYNHVGVENFKLNRFREKDITPIKKVETILESTQYFNGVHSDNFNDLGNLNYYSDLDNNSPNGYGVQFGPTNKITNKEKSFADTGILSRLFDGYTFCDGGGVYRRIQIDADEELGGFNMKLPKELDITRSAGSNFANDYFAINMRGATNFSDSGAHWLKPAVIDFSFDFYTRTETGEYEMHSFIVEDVEIKADAGDRHYSDEDNAYVFLGFYPDVLNDHIKSRMVGIGFHFDVVNNPTSVDVDNPDYNPEVDVDEFDPSIHEFNLFLYEYFLPFQTWY